MNDSELEAMIEERIRYYDALYKALAKAAGLPKKIPGDDQGSQNQNGVPPSQ